MTSSSRYVEKAAQFAALAEETLDNPELRASYVRMAQGYLRLAGHTQARSDADTSR